MQETQEMWVRSLGQEDSLEEEVATHSSILAREISWTEEPGGLQSTGSQRGGHDRPHMHDPLCGASSKHFVRAYSILVTYRYEEEEQFYIYKLLLI